MWWDSQLEGVYERLEPTMSKYLTWKRRADLNASWGIVTFYVVMLGSLIAVNAAGWAFGTFVFLIVAFLYLLALIVFGRIALRKRRKYLLSVDERALFFVCSILKNLQLYSETDNAELKKEYRNSALKDANNLLSTIENEWVVGHFKLANKIFGDSISKLKNNLRSRLVPNISEQEGNLEEVQKISYNFAHILFMPTIKDLQHLNDSVFGEIKELKPMKFGLIARFRLHKSYRYLTYASGIAALILAPILVFFVGTNYIGIPNGSAYTAAASVFGLLLIWLLNYAIRRPKQAP